MSIPCFSKVCFRLLCFYKRPTLVLFLVTKRNLKRIFDFTKKKKKVKNKIAFNMFWGSMPPEQQVCSHQSPSLGPILSISASGHHSLELYLWASGLYLHLFCVSIYKMCSKVPEKPKRDRFFRSENAQKFSMWINGNSLLNTILGYKRFNRKSSLMGSRRNL